MHLNSPHLDCSSLTVKMLFQSWVINYTRRTSFDNLDMQLLALMVGISFRFFDDIVGCRCGIEAIHIYKWEWYLIDSSFWIYPITERPRGALYRKWGKFWSSYLMAMLSSGRGTRWLRVPRVWGFDRSKHRSRRVRRTHFCVQVLWWFMMNDTFRIGI